MMNVSELRAYLDDERILNRFQPISSSARRWLKREVDAGRVWKARDEFPRSLPIYAKPGASDYRFRRAGYRTPGEE